MKNHLNRSQTLLSISISIYLLMVSGTFAVSLWLMVNPREGSVLPDTTRDYIEKEVDRSYGRFATQFNFAIFLIGTSVWILRQSVISQLKADVEKDLGATLRNELEETIQKDVKEEADKQVEAGIKSKLDDYLSENKIADSLEKTLSLDRKLKAQLEKSRIIEELSMFIPPEEVFFQEQTDPKIQERLKKLVSELTDHIESHIESHKESLSLTVDDYTKLGDALYCLENYEKAEEQYKNATKEHSEAYRALFGIGNALLRQGQNQQRQGQDEQADKLFQ
ncbi:hypothetical protein NIES4075_51860 [Tolypothrix sp. NIES-4075]|uniref:tetratricopeptide repeat protein n=1 Tax=Tolypothrix sp. NIES-4075 TaxID=2005459 RepID=UPI000B66EA54|nr:tetratricopeptide repeat protein [Tolypothrix sp. NIES-4075]GAX44169.1 hypothetical protein NIES4075_51860 [Tolypothrix sp. NIES-4075]